MSWAGLVIHTIYTDTYRNSNDTRLIFHKFILQNTLYEVSIEYIYVD